MVSFLYPKLLILIIPGLLILLFLAMHDFVKIRETDLENYKKIVRRRKADKMLIAILRGLTIITLGIALATPFTEQEKEVEGDPTITLLIDNSSSYNLYQTGSIDELKSKLEEQIPVRIGSLGHDTVSDIGDGILQYLGRDSSLLVVSDGQNNYGTTLSEIALFARNINATINVLAIEPEKNDFAVTIEGPSKTVADIDNTFAVTIKSAKEEENKISILLTLMLDNETILDQEVFMDQGTTELRIPFTKALSLGTHQMTARIKVEDTFSRNDFFSKSISVVEKPKLLYITDTETKLNDFMTALYDVTKKPFFPQNKEELEQYYAVILEDMRAERIQNMTLLREYLDNGNGLVVIGGQNSFDLGDYKSSEFESFLPVYVGTGEKQRSTANIVVVIDISGSGKGNVEGNSKSISGIAKGDVQKALALSIIDSINVNNKVGVVAFNLQAYEVAPIQTLWSNKATLQDRIPRLINDGQTLIYAGLQMAYDMLLETKGDKNIILISDGMDPYFHLTADFLKEACTGSLKIYTVGVGEDTEVKVMGRIAELCNGVYFQADASNKIKILFGESDDDFLETDYALAILNANHFITQGASIDATVAGYNDVVPKSNALSLITLQTGEPALTVWRYGLGRVATITAFGEEDPLLYLLTEQNSRIMAKTINWAIGDPERNKETYVQVSDTRINTPTTIVVKAAKFPEAEGLTFYKSDEDIYVSTVTPTTRGFHEVLGKTYAVNYEREFEALGNNPALESLALMTGGKVFKSPQADLMVEHVKARSKRMKIQKVMYRWHFVALASALFLCEVSIRRIRTYNRG